MPDVITPAKALAAHGYGIWLHGGSVWLREEGGEGDELCIGVAGLTEHEDLSDDDVKALADAERMLTAALDVVQALLRAKEEQATA